MKKKKGDDKAPVDFNNNPFKYLKGFSPPRSTAETKVAPRSKKDVPKEDDSELFLKAVTGTRKIHNKDSSTGNDATQELAALPGQAVALQESELFLAAMQKIGTTIKDVHQQEQENLEPVRKSASSRMRQLKRGTLFISRQLDLHGCLRAEALKRLEQFILEAFNRGQQAVLVITGKGLNSPEGPVLQGAVAAWLRDRGKKMVAEFGSAPRDLGGSGAFVVFLKKRGAVSL